MKLKTTLLTAIILTISSSGLAQKADPAKAEPVKAAVAAAPKLPTVKDVLDKYVKALGGREANEKVKTRLMTGTIELSPMGIKGTFESYTSAESKAQVKMNISGVGEIIDVTDGKSAWSLNPIQGNREKSGAELAQSKLSNAFYREINLDKLYPKIEMKGIEKVGGRDTYVMVATPEGLPVETWYFDTVSGLLVRSDSTVVSPEGNQAAKVFYDEMRAVDGVNVPVRIRTQLPQFEIVMVATDVKHIAVADESRFAKPKL